MRESELLRLLAAGYTLRADERGFIEAIPPAVGIPDEGISPNPEEENPLSKQDRHRYR